MLTVEKIMKFTKAKKAINKTYFVSYLWSHHRQSGQGHIDVTMTSIQEDCYKDGLLSRKAINMFVDEIKKVTGYTSIIIINWQEIQYNPIVDKK